MQGNVNIPDSTITTNLSFRQLVLMNMQQLTNFPYIEKDFDALTDYELLCLVVKFLNDVIANQNEQNDSITRMYESFLALQTYVNNTKDTLEDAFNNLDNYVRNYFDNLDVQDEINNKLDKMLEDGVLTEIIQQFLQSTAIWAFDTVSDMKQATNLISGSYARTYGFYEKNDGGSAFYKIRTKIEEDIVDEVILIAIGDTLVAELIYNDYMFVESFGAYGDGTHNDANAIIKALSTISNIKFHSNKTYLISSNINVENNKYINGQNCKLILDNNSTAFNITGDNNIIENFRIYKGTINYYGINIDNGATNNTIKNIYGEGLTYSLIMNDGINSIIENCYAYNCDWDCVSNYSHSKNGLIKNCKAIVTGRHGFSTDVGAEKIIFEDCYTENIGYITGEGHTSYHLEGAIDCEIRNCKAIYNENHKVFTDSFTGLLTPCRIEGQYDNKINGLTINIKGNFDKTRLFVLYTNHTSSANIPKIYINNLYINSDTTDTLNTYLGVSHLYIENSNIIGKVTFKQESEYGQIKKLFNCKINTTDLTVTFYHAQYKLNNSIISNNEINNSNALLQGRIIDTIIENNVFKDCTQSVILTQATGDSSAKSQRVLFTNNVIDGCTNGLKLGWASDENIFIFNNVFKNTITTILTGNYVTVHYFNNYQQNLTYTNLKDNVTIISSVPILDIT